MSIQAIKILIFFCLPFLAAILVNGNPLSPPGSPATDSISIPSRSLKVLSWNIGMLPVVDLFKDYDIIVFQEAFTFYARNVIGHKLHGLYPYAYGPINQSLLSLRINSGIWILSKIPLTIVKTIEFNASAGMDGLARKGAVLLEGRFYGAPFQLIATHLQDDEYPQSIREQQLTEIHEKLIAPCSEPGTPQIICGDFNTDEKMVANYRGMLALLDAEDCGVSGAVRVTFDDEANDVYQSPHPDPRRIDFVLTRNAQFILNMKEEVAVLKSGWGDHKQYLSDHNGLEAVIRFKSPDYLTKVFK